MAIGNNNITIGVSVNPGNSQAELNRVVAAVESSLARNAQLAARYTAITNQLTQRGINLDAAAHARLTRQISAEYDARQRAAERAARQAEALANRSAGAGGSGLFGAVAGGSLVAGAVAATTSVLVSGGSSVLEYSAKLEQVRIGFETLTGSAQNAQKHIAELQDFAKRTPFSFDGLADGSRLLQGVGVKDQEVIPIISDVGNLLAAAGKGKEAVDRTLLALSQIVSKGKLAGQEINQLSENGISVVRILAETTGKSQGEIRKLSEEGRISSDLLLEAIKRFVAKNDLGDAMVRQSRTFNGALSNIQDSLLITGSKAFEPLFNTVSTLAVDLADKLNANKDGMEGVGELIGEALVRGMGAALAGAGTALVNQLAEEVKNGKILYRPFGGPALTGIIKSVNKATEENRGIVEIAAYNLGVPGGKSAAEKDAENRKKRDEENYRLGRPLEPRQYANEAVKKSAEDEGKKLASAFDFNKKADTDGEFLKIGRNAEADANKRIAALDKEADAVKSQIDLKLKLQKIQNTGDIDKTSVQIARENAGFEEKSLRLQISLVNILADKKEKALTAEQKSSGALDPIIEKANADRARLELEIEISKAQSAKQIEEAIKKTKLLGLELRDLGANASENGLVKILNAYETAGEAARIKFKEAGAEAVRLGTILNQNAALKDLNRAEFNNGRRGIDSEFKAFELAGRSYTELDGFERKLNLLKSRAEFSLNSSNSERDILRSQFYATQFNPNNPRSFDDANRRGFNDNLSSDAVAARDAKLAIAQLNLFTKGAGLSNSILGKGALADAILSKIPDENALINLLGLNNINSSDAGFLLSQRAIAERDKQAASSEQFRLLLEKDSFAESQKQRSRDLLNNVNSSGLSEAEKRSERIAIFDDLKGELNPEQRAQAIRDNKADRDDARNMRAEAVAILKSINDRIGSLDGKAERGEFNVSIGDQATTNINVRGENIRLVKKVDAKNNQSGQADVAASMGFFTSNEGGLTNR